jgi:hypothetical protein
MLLFLSFRYIVYFNYVVEENWFINELYFTSLKLFDEYTVL